MRGAQCPHERLRRMLWLVAGNRHECAPRFARRKREIVASLVEAEAGRRRIERQCGGAGAAIEPLITPDRLVRPVQRTCGGAATLAARAAHLEQIGKVAIELQAKAKVD